VKEEVRFQATEGAFLLDLSRADYKKQTANKKKCEDYKKHPKNA